MITLPNKRQTWPRVRVLVARTFNSQWNAVPMWRVGMRGFGFELLRYTRTALPGVGEAFLQFRYGKINGVMVGSQPESQNRQPWDPSAFTLSAPDLRGYEIRIQVAELTVTEPEWSTAWWGTIEQQTDTEWPGASYPAGVRSYYCVDGFFRTKRWMLDCHSAKEAPAGASPGAESLFLKVDGHPGYNVGQDGRVIGNRSAFDFDSIDDAEFAGTDTYPGFPELLQLAQLGDDGYCLMTHQGRTGARTFTVQTALEAALRERRPFGEPVFSFNGTEALLADEIAMPVREGDSAWDLVSRHCRRERGRGLVWVDWNSDAADPDGPLTVFLSVQPQTYEDIEWSDPTADTDHTIPGAANEDVGRLSTAIDVDLIGDHRLMAEDFQLSQQNIHRADAVETIGERIQVLATLSYFDQSGDVSVSLAQRWTDDAAADFSGLDPEKRTDDSWVPLWCLHGLPLNWGGKTGDADGGGMFGCDARCDDDGYFTTSASVTLDAGRTINITSPINVSIMADLPIYEGYDYSVNPPVRRIGNNATLDETSVPARRAPFAFIRKDSDRYIMAHELADGQGLGIQVRGRDLLISSSKDQAAGTRIVSDTEDESLGAEYDIEALSATVGLEMPHRVRRRTVRDGVINPVRTVRIRVPDLHLWLAASGAVWDLDGESGDADGIPGRRNAAGGINATMGILRDDRAALSRLHAMASTWYLGERRTATWSLRCCGGLVDFEVLATDAEGNPSTERIEYPYIGQVVHHLSSGGQTRVLNTPITSESYDHTTGIHTWATDWPELDIAP